MRIAILSDAANPTPAQGYHGLGRIVHQLVIGLAARGHSITLYAGQGSATGDYVLHPLPAGTPTDGYRGEYTLAKLCYAEHQRKPFDAILDNGHLHVLSRLFPALPVVNVYHDIWQPYQRCAVLLSDGQKALMPPEFGRSRVIPNAIDPTPYTAGDTPADPPYVLFMGGMFDYKQPLLAIEAASRAGIKLIIAGPGALPANETNNVEHVGVVTGDRKHALLCGASVFLQLGHSESFGITTVEAGLSGVPVVAWPTGGTVDLIKHGCNGAFIPIGTKDKVKAVADTITRALAVDRAQARQTTLETLTTLDEQLDAYETALEDCVKGVWW